MLNLSVQVGIGRVLSEGMLIAVYILRGLWLEMIEIL